MNFSCKTCHDIADAIMVDVMKIKSSEDIYQNSSPTEILRFKNFIKSCKFPFDCVIDFPNLMYVKKEVFQKYRIYSNILSDLVNNLVLLKQMLPNMKNICLIGKYTSGIDSSPEKLMHDLKQRLWNCKLKLNINLNVSHYFSDKFTKDDVLILYVALKSGPDCFIVSNDKFRSHGAEIKDVRLQKYFINWQNHRQIFIKNINSDHLPTRADERFVMPFQYEKCIHYDPKRRIYHIPYWHYQKDDYKQECTASPIKWACFKL